MRRVLRRRVVDETVACMQDWATHLLPLAIFGCMLYGVGYPLYLFIFFRNLKSNMKGERRREVTMQGGDE